MCRLMGSSSSIQ
ncbi:unnamed protein product [Lathyrus sativus]|nr:unnamed protein product [Lathyrus sativus]